MLIAMLPVSVFATSGNLRKASIKTCPDGVTYGNHESNHVIHWHVAVPAPDSWSGWAASGDPIPNDPCSQPVKIRKATTTVATTRRATTRVATTRRVTTSSSTTEVPTTEISTTEISTTEVPNTEVPTTEIPTTEYTTTVVTTQQSGEEATEASTSTGGAIFGLAYISGIGLAVYKGVKKKR